MAIIDTRDGSIEYTRIGSGRDLVLLHSLLTDYSAFDRLLPTLAGQRRITLVRLPGFGASDPVGADIDQYADRLAALFEAIDLPRGSDLMGNGFGGFVALAFAARHGHRFERLLAVDTGAAFPEPGRLAFGAMAEAVGRGGMAAVLDAAVARLFPQAFRLDHPGLVTACKAVLLRADPQAFATACRTLQTLDLRAAAARVKNPTLVVVGLEDEATPPPMSRELAALLPHATLIELPGCGHAPQLQQPEVLLRVIAPFLSLPAAA